jgi:predicted aspartyl protease
MTVESSRFPFLPLLITIGGHAIEVSALIDTGFEGYTVLPELLVPPGLEPTAFHDLELADGTVIEVPMFAATIQLGDFEAVTGSAYGLGEEPLVGLRVIERYSVIFDHGRRVIVEP